MTIEPQRALLALLAASASAAVFAFTFLGCGDTTNTITTTPPPPNLIPNLTPYPTPSGTLSTFSTAGSIDPAGIFFQPLGTNARSCGSCHQLSQAMGLSAANAQAVFASSNGADPLFLSVDGANCPSVALGDSAGTASSSTTASSASPKPRPRMRNSPSTLRRILTVALSPRIPQPANPNTRSIVGRFPPRVSLS